MNLGFSTRKEKAITEGSEKLNAEAAKQRKKCITDALRTLDPSTKFMGKDINKREKKKAYTTSSFIEDIDQLDITKEEDQKALKKAFENGKTPLHEKTNLELEKQRQGIILQLNLQKAQLKAQKAAAMSQLKIKDEYDKQQINLKALTSSFGGEFLTERQKSEIKFQEALNRASEQLALKEDSASANLRNQLLSMKDDTLQNELKKNLLKSEMDKDYGDVDPESEEYKSKLEFLARTVDLTERLNEMSAEELQTLYEQVKVDDAIKKKIQVVLAKQNSVDLAEKEKELAKQRAGDEKTINDLVADRLDAIKKQKEAHEDYIRTMALGDKISNEVRKPQNCNALF